MKLKDFDFRIWDGEKYINLKNDGGNDSITHRCEGYAIGLIGDEKPIYTIKAGVEYNGYTYDDYKYVENLSVDENKCEIELFTGFCDKNGNKIYEGDILYYFKDCSENEVFKYQVLFKEGALYLFESYDGFVDDEDLIAEFDLKELQVMGNIHENSELIKGIE